MPNEPETDSEPETDTAAHDDGLAVTFVGFVVSLARTAAVHFGDAPGRVSGESTAANLRAAQQMIDILAVIEEKTRGNLTAEERRLLEHLLFDLRMRYIEAEKSEAPAPPQSRIIPP